MGSMTVIIPGFMVDEIVQGQIFLAPQVFSEDPKGFAKSQELGTSASNSLRFLTLNPLPLFFRKDLNVAHKTLLRSHHG
jgi:hypothetical protein